MSLGDKSSDLLQLSSSVSGLSIDGAESELEAFGDADQSLANGGFIESTDKQVLATLSLLYCSHPSVADKSEKFPYDVQTAET